MGSVEEHDGQVRRPIRENTELVRLVLERIASHGASWAPRFIGVEGDEEVLTWLPGDTFDDWRCRLGDLEQLAFVVRQLHDLTVDLAPEDECLVHDDLQPRNVVLDGSRLGLIDWEQLRPGRRVEDVAQLCWSFAGPLPEESVVAVAGRWQRIADAYGLVNRIELVPVSVAKIDRCIGDIVREAAHGSSRHAGFLERGDHNDLHLIRNWLLAHEASITSTIA